MTNKKIDPWDVLYRRIIGDTWPDIAKRYGVSQAQAQKVYKETGCMDTWSRGQDLLVSAVEQISNGRITAVAEVLTGVKR